MTNFLMGLLEIRRLGCAAISRIGKDLSDYAQFMLSPVGYRNIFGWTAMLENTESFLSSYHDDGAIRLTGYEEQS